MAVGLLVLTSPSDRSQSGEHASSSSMPAWVVAGQGRGVPAVDKARAFFISKRHEVLAIDIRSGSVVWRAGTGEAGDETMGSEVVLANGVLLVGDYNVVAFDAQTGRSRWRFVPKEGYGPGIYLGSTVKAGLAYAGSPAATMYAIDVEDGRERWTTRVDQGAKVTVHQPHICRDLVVAGYTRFSEANSGGIVALDRSSGALRWRTDFPPRNTHSTSYAGGPLCFGNIVGAAGGDGTIYGLRAETGSVAWTLPPVTLTSDDNVETNRPDYRPLAYANGRLIAGSLTGRVAAYDVRSRRLCWTSVAPDGGSVALRLAVDRDMVFVPHMNGLLTALDLSDGRERWRTRNTSGFSWLPAFSKDRILLASSASGFQAFDRPRR